MTLLTNEYDLVLLIGMLLTLTPLLGLQILILVLVCVGRKLDHAPEPPK